MNWLDASRLATQFNRLPLLRRSLLIVALGALNVLGFAPFFLWPLAFIALIGLMIVLEGVRATGSPWRAGFWRGWCYGLGHGLAGLFWIANAFLVDAEQFGALAPFAVTALAAGLALFWGVAGAVYGRFQSDNWRRAFLFAGVVGLTEFLRANILTGFPWNLPGHIWQAGGTVSQIASIIGASGLSVLTLFAAASITVALSSGARFAPRYGPLAATGLIFLVVVAAGAGRLQNQVIATMDGVGLRLVHADIPQRAKWQPENRDRIVQRYLDLSAADGLATRTHIIWPENALPMLLLEEAGVLERVGNALGSERLLLAGVVRRERGSDEDWQYYNSLAALRFSDDIARVEGVYDKQRLVPFGEFVPAAGLISRLGFASLASVVGGFERGRGNAVTTIPGLPDVSAQICYEAIFPGFTPRGADRPGWILNVSNDAWFGTHVGPAQFFNQSRYRAIEEGMPLVRSAVGGVSGVIDPYGRILAMRGPGNEGVVDAPLPASLPPPLYAMIGDALVIVMLLVGLWLGLAHNEQTDEETPDRG